MSNTNYLPAKHFREFKEFKIENIFPFYRTGGIMDGKGKFHGRTFVFVDGALKEEKWEELEGKNVKKITALEGDVVVYDKKTKESESIPFEDALKDWRFWSTYRKVFDVKISVKKEVTVDGKTGTVFVINRLGSWKIQEMLREDFELKIPMNGDREAFDWEDKEYTRLLGTTFKLNVTGKDFDTRYKFKLVDAGEDTQPGFEDKKAEDITPEDLPF